MFAKVLIANRGEIAIRVMRTCREMGIRTVAVYSDADARSRHVLEADEAVRLGPAAPSESYLRGDLILDAARACGAEAIHPGYGFLSENAAFAQACADAGVVFIGPPPAAMIAMGSKIGARRLMQAAGVPVVPGETPPDQTDEALLAALDRVGRPALVKPSARRRRHRHARRRRGMTTRCEAVQAARRDAEHAFGNGTLYVERLVERPRHVEIQIFADAHDGCVSLFERECSVQRRHQKVIEESPSPVMTPDAPRADGRGRRRGRARVRVPERRHGRVPRRGRRHRDAAVLLPRDEHAAAGRAPGDGTGHRAVDLVRAQLLVAAGQPLPFPPDRLAQRGHAIELRVYAEDPSSGFLPQAGTVLLYREPRGPGIRVDSSIGEGDTVSVHYDPLLAKLIVSAETRAAALARADRALGEFAILGIVTNIPLLRALVRHPDVRAGRLDTGLLDRLLPSLLPRRGRDSRGRGRRRGRARRATSPRAALRPTSPPRHDPWAALQGRRP